jgi:polysaccharide export outer membrane protein
MPMMSRRLLLLVCLLLSVAGLTFAQSSASAGAGNTGILSSQSAPPLVIGPGDALAVTVFEIKELSGNFRVSQKGQIDLPLIGKTNVAGLTADEAAAEIQSKLKGGGFVLNPEVTVLITNYATQGANVMGQVNRPGIYPTLGSRTLLDMLTLAGGVTPSAGKLVTIIHRDDPHHPVYLALAQNAAGLKLQANPIILPGDTIIVQKSGIVYVLGAVNRPGGYLIDNNERLTLMQALSLAGGSMVTSKMKDVRLIRKTRVGEEEIRLNLKKVYRGKEADITVADGDILYVPSSNIKTFIYQGYTGLISSANTAVFATQF